jgi:hypothetical protein
LNERSALRLLPYPATNPMIASILPSGSSNCCRRKASLGRLLHRFDRADPFGAGGGEAGVGGGEIGGVDIEAGGTVRWRALAGLTE